MSAAATPPVSVEHNGEQHASSRPPRRNRARGSNRPDQGRRRLPSHSQAEATFSNYNGNPLAMRPASVTPSRANNVQNQEDSTTTATQSRRGTHHGATRGRHNEQATSGRRFGGKLTSRKDQAPPSVLHGDAPEFVPGSNAGTSGEDGTVKIPQKRRESKSTAPDIGTRIHQDIDHRQYECPICTNEVLRNSRIWSCHKCWTVFHLSCIKQWSFNNDTEAVAQANGDAQPLQPRQWRCPGCNLAQDVKPSSYTCWCGKEHSPRSIPGLPPHSCGNTCGNTRAVPKCPHVCELLCHAGPCPPCTRDGPTQTCFCGKKALTRKCVDTDYNNGWSCGSVCEDLMPCGEHTCPRECHEGLCGACEVRVDARCYCGQEEKAILCCDREDDITSTSANITADGETVTEEWLGRFTCSNSCQRYFDCGKHKCSKSCHPQDGAATHCPRSPDVVKDCPCGKTPLVRVSSKPRQTCEDPIPSCSEA